MMSSSSISSEFDPFSKWQCPKCLQCYSPSNKPKTEHQAVVIFVRGTCQHDICSQCITKIVCRRNLIKRAPATRRAAKRDSDGKLQIMIEVPSPIGRCGHGKFCVERAKYSSCSSEQKQSGHEVIDLCENDESGSSYCSVAGKEVVKQEKGQSRASTRSSPRRSGIPKEKDPAILTAAHQTQNQKRQKQSKLTKNVNIALPIIPPAAKEDLSNIKLQFAIGDEVFSAWWDPKTDPKRKRNNASYYPGKIKSVEQTGTGPYGPICIYSITYEDGDELEGVEDYWVFAKRDYELNMEYEEKGVTPIGVYKSFDRRSSDKWARMVGWYEVTIDGKEQAYSSMLDAMRAHDACVVRKHGAETKMSLLNIPEDYPWLFPSTTSSPLPAPADTTSTIVSPLAASSSGKIQTGANQKINKESHNEVDNESDEESRFSEVDESCEDEPAVDEATRVQNESVLSNINEESSDSMGNQCDDSEHSTNESTSVQNKPVLSNINEGSNDGERSNELEEPDPKKAARVPDEPASGKTIEGSNDSKDNQYGEADPTVEEATSVQKFPVISKTIEECSDPDANEAASVPDELAVVKSIGESNDSKDDQAGADAIEGTCVQNMPTLCKTNEGGSDGEVNQGSDSELVADETEKVTEASNDTKGVSEISDVGHSASHEEAISDGARTVKRRRLDPSPKGSLQNTEFWSVNQEHIQFTEQAFMTKSLFHLNSFVDGKKKINRGFSLFLREGIATPGFEPVPTSIDIHRIAGWTQSQLRNEMVRHGTEQSHVGKHDDSQTAMWLKNATVGSFVIMRHEYPRCRFCPKRLKDKNGKYIGPVYVVGIITKKIVPRSAEEREIAENKTGEFLHYWPIHNLCRVSWRRMGYKKTLREETQKYINHVCQSTLHRICDRPGQVYVAEATAESVRQDLWVNATIPIRAEEFPDRFDYREPKKDDKKEDKDKSASATIPIRSEVLPGLLDHRECEKKEEELGDPVEI